MNRLVTFVEGSGDTGAVPILVKRLATDHDLWGDAILDPEVFRVGGPGKLGGRNAKRWLDLLRAALKRTDVAAILVVLDGDVETWEKRAFCAREVARTLADRAKQVGAGKTFSLAVVFACLEFESWLLAAVESLAGKQLPDGRSGVRAGIPKFEGDLEVAPRDAKGELSRLMASGYKASTDQGHLASMVDLSLIRERHLKSFARFEKAVLQLFGACRTGQHIATPPSG
jgi:hypothetical protein